jgi:hypothetical protein
MNDISPNRGPNMRPTHFAVDVGPCMKCGKVDKHFVVCYPDGERWPFCVECLTAPLREESGT